MRLKLKSFQKFIELMYNQGRKEAQDVRGSCLTQNPKERWHKSRVLPEQTTMTHFRDCKDHSPDIRGLSLLLAMCNRGKERERDSALQPIQERSSLLGVNKGPHQTGSAMETKLLWRNAGS